MCDVLDKVENKGKGFRSDSSIRIDASRLFPRPGSDSISSPLGIEMPFLL